MTEYDKQDLEMEEHIKFAGELMTAHGASAVTVGGFKLSTTDPASDFTAILIKQRDEAIAQRDALTKQLKNVRKALVRDVDVLHLQVHLIGEVRTDTWEKMCADD